jgi:hypothetical protein
VDKWNQYKNQLRDMLTKPDGTVDMEDGTGAIVSLPTFPALQKLVTSLTDEATGAVAGARESASSAAMSASDASKSQDAAAASADAAKTSQDTVSALQVSAATSESNAAASASSSSAASVAAGKSATAAGTSEANAATSESNAKTSADAAASSRDASDASKTLAQQYANAPVNVEVSLGQYSAYHWSEQARLNALGSIVYKGGWDASGGKYPTSPKLGDFYLITVGGTMDGVKHSVGDMMLYDGAVWDRVDNQQSVTSVAGRVGNVVLTTADIGGLQGALDGKQGSLGFTPVQQGTGVGQSNNNIKIGWSGAVLKLTVDSTDMGAFAIQSWVDAGYLNRNTGGTVSGGMVFNAGMTVNGQLSANGPVYATDGNPGAGIANGGNGGNRGLTAHANNNGGSSATSAACITFIRDGQFGGYLGIDTDNQLKVGGWSYGNVAYRVVHEGLANPSFNGIVTASSEFRTASANGYRITGGNRGFFWRFDGAALYGLLTNDGDPYGGFSGLRPFQIEYTTGRVTMGHGLSVNGADVVCSNWVYANNFQVQSDKRLKSNEVTLDGRAELEKLKRLVGLSYDKAGVREYGFFAQSFRDVYPTMVKSGKGAAGDDTLSVSLLELLAPIVAAVQHLDHRLTKAGL